MQIQDRFLDAVNTVLDFDYSDEVFPEAITCHLAGSEADWSGDVWRYDLNDVGRYGIGRRVH
jgi:hypothetical protein